MAPPPGLRLLLHRPLHCRAPCIQSFRRDISGTAYNRSQAGESSKPEKQAEKVSPRWLSDVKSRIGKCIIFGLKPEQLERAGSMLKTVSKEWRSLVAGSEGYLTGPKRGGLEKHSIVWGEQDTMGHVNNVMYVRYAESARIEWARNFALYHDREHKNEWEELWTPAGFGFILRSIRTDYKFPMTWPDRISVYHKLRSYPSAEDDSIILDVVILSERQQRPAARCEEDIVVYDYKKGKKTALREFMVIAFQDTYKLQEETKAKSTQRILELLGQVEALEKESWDRKDAKEDLGSAA